MKAIKTTIIVLFICTIQLFATDNFTGIVLIEDPYSFNTINENFLDENLPDIIIPTFTDLDNDGLADLIIGGRQASLSHYERNSLDSLTFHLVNDTLSNIDVGFSPAPAFTDLDNDGLLDLIIGEFEGNLNHYEQNSINSFEFSLVTNTFNSIDVGNNSVPTFTDLDSDEWDKSSAYCFDQLEVVW